MSVIFGIFYRDGRPVSDELETMYSGMSHFPHERHAFVKMGNCGFGHMLTYNTPEAVGEAMPKWIEAAHLMFVAEGRIDNRGELFEALSIPSSEQAAMPDGDLMLAAYLKWGETCVGHLMGKWSLAAFHTDDQRLFLARDKWDYTAIDYYADDKVFAFATSSKGILPLPFVKTEIDKMKIARLLVIWPGDFDKTFFIGIVQLLPSHTLRVTRENTLLNRYWNYADIPVRYGLKLEDYCDDLFDKFNLAVAARLRSYKPVAGTLSGGMDSSSVCYLAAEQLAKQGKRLRTYTHVPLFAPSQTLSKYSFGDERPFVEAIAKASGNIDPTYLNSANLSPLKGIEEALRLCGAPFHGAGNAYWMVDIYETAAREGYGTLLMGEFGNATISWTGNADALPVRGIYRRYGIRGVVKKKLLKPLLYGNTPVAHLYKRMVYGKCPWRERTASSEAFEESLHLAQRIKESGGDPIFKRWFSDAKGQVTRILDVNVSRHCMGAQFGCETGLEMRDPTGDPRLIESALSIPNEMFLGPMNKWVLRTMMKGRLPDDVRLNNRKGKQSSDLIARLCKYPEEMDAILAEMDAAGFGRIADMDRLHREWEGMKADGADYPLESAFHLLRPVSAYLLYRMH